MNDIDKKIEAVLFVVGDPVSIKKLAETAEHSEDEVKEAIDRLKEKYAADVSGLHLIDHDSGIQLTTKPELAPIIEKLVKGEVHEELTPAALETLSLVSYLGPISKSSLEYIRGVNSSFILRNLLIRGLVERVTHPKKANTFLYRPTSDLLRHLGVSSKEDLPEFAKYQELKETIENE